MIQEYKSIAIQQNKVIIYLKDNEQVVIECGKLTSIKKLIKAICERVTYKVSPENLDSIIVKDGTFRAIFYLGDRRDIVIVKLDELKTEYEAFTKQLLKKIKPEEDDVQQ